MNLRSLLLMVATVALGLTSGCNAEDGSLAEPTADAPDAIVGGVETEAVAAIGYLTAVIEKDGEPYSTDAFCTGSLIAPDVVLSAAHCFSEELLMPEGYTFVGFAFGMGKIAAGNVTMVSEVESHPKYAEGDDQHDVAWLVLDRPVNDVTVAKVRRSAHLGNCDYAAIGYGVNKEGARKEDELAPDEYGVRKSIAMCADRGLVKGMIQAYNGDRGTPCYGDSGGALRVKNTMEIIGVASSISSDCEKNGFAYYAPLAKNLEFIDEGLAQSKYH